MQVETKMAGFKDYLRDMKNEFFDDQDDDYDEDLVKVLKIAVEYHKEDVVGFLKKLGQFDHKIQDALEEIRQSKNNDMADFGRRGKSPFRDGLPPGSMHGRPGHEVVPSSADSITGDGSGQ
jgi:hypothetical protein